MRVKRSWPTGRRSLDIVIRLLVIWPLILYVLMIVSFMLFRESLVYPGVRMFQHLSLEDPGYEEMAREAGAEFWFDANGGYLGLKRESESAQMRWLVLHGNGDVGLRATGWFDVLQGVLDGMPVSFYVLEYPGYGPQAGKPGEEAIVSQLQHALESLPDDEVPLYFFGQSMGAGVACRMVAEAGLADRVAGLWLCNPYTSLVDAGRHYVRGLVGPAAGCFPVEKILGERYDSLENIQRYSGPVVILAGGDDTLTPPEMARELASAVPGPSRLWIQQGVGHWVSPEPRERWVDLMNFLTRPTGRDSSDK